MKWLHGVCLITLVCAASACQSSVAAVVAESPAATKPQPASTPQTQAARNQEINDRFVKQFMERIVGHQTEPAEKVFKNIRWLKGARAEGLLLIMNLGYARALGVTCTHCHVEQDFASDDKRPKRAAREMAAMHRMINDELKKMSNLETPAEKRAINCSTCHRGAIDPLASER